jgi:hypothetical protein
MRHDKEQQIVDKEQQIVDKEQQIVDKEQQIVDKEQQTVDKEQQTVDKEQQTVDKEQQTVDKEQQIVDKEQQIVETFSCSRITQILLCVCVCVCVCVQAESNIADLKERMTHLYSYSYCVMLSCGLVGGHKSFAKTYCLPVPCRQSTQCLPSEYCTVNGLQQENLKYLTA